MSDSIEHGVIHISYNFPSEIVGFLVEGGNCDHAIAIYENEIYQDRAFDSLEESVGAMTKAKQVMEDAGYTCGDVLTQTNAAWMALVIQRPLTEEEIEQANTLDEEE